MPSAASLAATPLALALLQLLLAAPAADAQSSVPPSDAQAAYSLVASDGLATVGSAGGVAPGAASPWAALSSQVVAYPLTQATTLALGSYLQRPAAAPGPALPSGFAARSLSAWVKCDAPAAAGSPGRTILDLSDGSSSIFTEHFAVLGAAAAAPAAISTPQYNTTTFAGSGCTTFADGPAATNVGKLGTVYSIKVARDGTIYFLDRSYNSVRMITPAGNIQTIAGGLTQQSGAADGVGTSATFNAPFGLALNNAETALHIADYSNNKVRRVLLNGTVTSICGAGGSGYIDGPAAGAKFTNIQYITVDKSDVMYITENLRIRLCNLTSGNGNVSTFAGTGVAGTSFDGPLNGTLGAIGTNAPRGVAWDPTGRFFYWTDYSGCKLRVADLLTGMTSTPAGTPGVAPPATCASTNGFGSSANFGNPVDMASDPVGNLYVMDVNGRRLRKVSPAGMVQTIIGSGASGGNAAGVGTNAAIGAPGGVGVDPTTGDVYMGDTANCKIWKGAMPKQTVFMAAPVCDGTRWRHIVATMTNASSAALYVDGALVASSAAIVPNTALGAAPVLGIGGAIGAAELFSGAIADVRVFNRSLSAAEALALFRPPMPAFGNATLSPDPSTAPASTTTFTYSCNAGFVGATVLVTRGASGAWSSNAPVSCTQCSADQFSLPGGTQCITIPSLGAFPLTTWTPAVPAAGVTSYVASCTQPGASGLTRYLNYSAASNSFQFDGPVQCTACNAATEFSLAPAAGGAAGFQCRTCASVDSNLVVSSAIAGYAGSQQCGCRNNFYSNGATAGVETALACTACPTGSTSNRSAATCVGSPNFVCTGSAATLACFCVASYTQTGTGSASVCTPPSPTPTPSITPTPSPSASSTPSFTASVSPTISTTSTASFSPTPTTTVSMSPTPSPTRTPSNTVTPSNTPTPTNTPSPSGYPAGARYASARTLAAPSLTAPSSPPPSNTPCSSQALFRTSSSTLA